MRTISVFGSSHMAGVSRRPTKAVRVVTLVSALVSMPEQTLKTDGPPR
ncbi:MAG: hypothetical protein U0361_08510 [Nitrospiraceae bacterium]